MSDHQGRRILMYIAGFLGGTIATSCASWHLPIATFAAVAFPVGLLLVVELKWPD